MSASAQSTYYGQWLCQNARKQALKTGANAQNGTRASPLSTAPCGLLMSDLQAVRATRTLPPTARRVGRARMQARQRFSPVLPFCPQPPFSPRVNSPCLRVPQNPTSLGRLKCRCHRHRRPRVPESRGTPPSQISASVVLRQATARAGAKQASSCAPPCTSPRPTPIMGIGFAKKAQKQGVEPGANARNEDRARR
jgi:hypothetical protein